MRKFLLTALLFCGCFAGTARGQTGIITLSVSATPTNITVNMASKYVVIQENTATPTNAYTIALPGQTGVTYPAGNKFIFTANDNGFVRGQVLGTISIASSTSTFVGIESIATPTIPANAIQVDGVTAPKPANFQDSASVTWTILNGNIEATAVGGGSGGCAPAGSNGQVQIKNNAACAAGAITDNGSTLTASEPLTVGSNAFTANGGGALGGVFSGNPTLSGAPAISGTLAFPNLTASELLCLNGSFIVVTSGCPASGIGGSIASPEVAFATTANTIGGDTSFTFDNTNKILGIPDINGIEYVDGVHFTSLASALTACPNVGCTVYDTHPETWSTDQFAGTFGKQIDIYFLSSAAGNVWYVATTQHPQATQRLIGSGRVDGTLGAYGSGTAFVAVTGISTNPANCTSVSAPTCSSAVFSTNGTQGSTFEHMFIDCANIATVGIYATDWNENAGALFDQVANCSDSQIKVDATESTYEPAQNWIMQDLEAFPGTGALSTTNGYTIIGDGGCPSRMESDIAVGISGHPFNDGISINNNCIDLHIYNFHAEQAVNAIETASSFATIESVSNFNGTCTVKIDNGHSLAAINLLAINANMTTYALCNPQNGDMLVDATLAFYSLGDGTNQQILGTSALMAKQVFNQPIYIFGAPTYAEYYDFSNPSTPTANNGALRLSEGAFLGWQSYTGVPGQNIQLGLDPSTNFVTANGFASGFLATNIFGSNFRVSSQISCPALDTDGSGNVGCNLTVGPTLATNGTNNPSQSVLNISTSSTNTLGLTATPVNPSGGIVREEIAGTPTGTWDFSGVTLLKLPATADITGLYYQTLEQGGTAEAQEPKFNFINGTNMTITCVDNSGSTRTDCTFTSSATGATAFSSLTAATNTNTGNFIVSGGGWDFTGAVKLIAPISAAYAPTANGSFGYNSTSNLWAFGQNGSTLTLPQSQGAVATEFLSSYNQATGAFGQRALVSADVPNNAANTSGNAATATAAASTPTLCTTGQAATGVTATFNATGCTAYVQDAGDLGGTAASPTVVNLSNVSNASLGTSAIAASAVTNAKLANSSTTVNGQTCTLGSSCTITASAGTVTVGTTTVASGTTGYFLTDNGGTLGNVIGPQAIANASHKWLNSFTASTGLFTQTQPADTDLSGTTAGAELYISSSAVAELATTAYSVKVSGATNPAWATPTGNAQCFMSAASSFATTIPSFQSCPSGFANPMTTLGDSISGGASGAPTRLAGPTTPNSVPEVLTSTPSGSAATAPAWSLPGVVGRAITGATSTDTIVSTDCNPKRVAYQGSVAVAVTLPTATTLAVPNCVFRVANNTTGSPSALTITPSSSWTINGGATLTVNQNQIATIYVDAAGGAWDADVSEGAISAGSNVTITRTANSTSIAASGGGSSPVYDTPSSAVHASITAVTMTTNGGAVHFYTLKWVVDETTAGTACVGNSSIVLNAIYTDPNASTSTTLAVASLSVSGNGAAGQTVGIGMSPILSKASQTIQYSTTYTADSSCSTGPTYQVQPVLTEDY